MAAPAEAALRVTTPRPETRLQAAQHARVQAVRLVTRGRAGRGQTVRIAAPCVLRLCVVSTVADRRGRWSTALDLVLPTRARSLAVTVAVPATGDQVDLDLDVERPPTPAPVAGRRWLVMTGDSLGVGTAAALPGQLAGPERDHERGLGPLPRAGHGRAAGHAAAGAPHPGLQPVHQRRRPQAWWRWRRRCAAAWFAPGRAAVRSGRRSAADGTSYARANALLERLALEPGLAGRLQVVPWAALHAPPPHAPAPGWRARHPGRIPRAGPPLRAGRASLPYVNCVYLWVIRRPPFLHETRASNWVRITFERFSEQL